MKTNKTKTKQKTKTKEKQKKKQSPFVYVYKQNEMHVFVVSRHDYHCDILAWLYWIYHGGRRLYTEILVWLQPDLPALHWDIQPALNPIAFPWVAFATLNRRIGIWRLLLRPQVLANIKWLLFFLVFSFQQGERGSLSLRFKQCCYFILWRGISWEH